MSLKKKLGNIIWHIENNRGVIGDTQVLDQVLVSLKGIESELPKGMRESGDFISTGFMNGIRAQESAPVTVNESLRRKKYGENNGYSQWDLAKDFFRMSNDAFFNIYGFNFVPKGRLFDEAKSFVASQPNILQGGFNIIS
ncbi:MULTISPECIES: hypothetical protein [Bacillus cereus group]|uniref:hypothetical protein n=1 Tax=Bacillus cereus group TaxID=86661 RepID=UPI0005DB2C0D|nr:MULTISPECIES: hypothetical protein [Bacillus cereus group]CKE77448.1 Uncharacterised protein [Streptococcus pneumoniae]MDA1510807.1 hypothetical protein [Bacillus cereus group sp. TH36-2LC]CKF33594.1 Uncharacterised protein [Bacillus paranthracis]CKG06815.1 Uncharacterised protein [Streptococcus pneumoniae]CKG60625.1 Uncharacterised protein [Streptococcus pneumoniae]